MGLQRCSASISVERWVQQIVQSSGSEIKIEPPRYANASMQTASFTRETAFDPTFTSKTMWYAVSSVIGAMLGNYSAFAKHEQACEGLEDAKQVLGQNSLGPVKSYPFYPLQRTVQNFVKMSSI